VPAFRIGSALALRLRRPRKALPLHTAGSGYWLVTRRCRGRGTAGEQNSTLPCARGGRRFSVRGGKLSSFPSQVRPDPGDWSQRRETVILLASASDRIQIWRNHEPRLRTLHLQKSLRFFRQSLIRETRIRRLFRGVFAHREWCRSTNSQKNSQYVLFVESIDTRIQLRKGIESLGVDSR
jgi:hypothetical protein